MPTDVWTDPVLCALSPSALALYFMLYCYAGDRENDGHMTMAEVQLVTRSLPNIRRGAIYVDELVRAGLLLRDPNDSQGAVTLQSRDGHAAVTLQSGRSHSAVRAQSGRLGGLTASQNRLAKNVASRARAERELEQERESAGDARTRESKNPANATDISHVDAANNDADCAVTANHYDAAVIDVIDQMRLPHTDATYTAIAGVCATYPGLPWSRLVKPVIDRFSQEGRVVYSPAGLLKTVLRDASLSMTGPAATSGNGAVPDADAVRWAANAQHPAIQRSKEKLARLKHEQNGRSVDDADDRRDQPGVDEQAGAASGRDR